MRHEVNEERVRMREIEGGSYLYVRAHRPSVSQSVSELLEKSSDRIKREYFVVVVILTVASFEHNVTHGLMFVAFISFVGSV